MKLLSSRWKELKESSDGRLSEKCNDDEGDDIRDDLADEELSDGDEGLARVLEVDEFDTVIEDSLVQAIETISL